MIKKITWAATALMTLGMGFLFAQDAAPAAGAKSTLPRIIRLEDRINHQRERITQGLAAHTITADQAQSCGTLLDSVMQELKVAGNAGLKRNLTKKVYDACNTELDTNSVIIKEQKQFCYFYGPYVDSAPTYEYDENQYPDPSAKPGVSHTEKTRPKIVELKDRLEAQRARIKMDLASNILTQDGAKNCEHVLDSALYQMKMDFTTNHSHHLTKDQYMSLNAMLDANSAAIQEGKKYFYYYDDPDYIRKNYWY